MGRRTRRRDPAAPPDPPRASPEASRRPRTFADRVVAAADARPKPPWHPFPLVELCVLVGIVLIVLGFLDFESRNGRTLLLMGLVLASLAGLDTAVRDHFAGFRSHSTLLASLPAVLAAGVLFFVRAPWPVLVVVAVAIFAGAFWFLRDRFRRRTGVHFRA